ncbi:MAG: hypothetical protein A2648_02045 [Candidatus Lloydbacteria bacterium RIFCSPHIGHO2_01_FULL_41_20]|uniref:Transglutaminase-like domain-containing protein n=1 Tax=Candidatus Lloydbacteria bacterium RIFCSPHIGHO2_01_FULL_41_20 TaxID=1798657 RepID=A0A1G2CQQ5_9BACT|nr:MAG: hypothetical protein A2648_02045 [Candidatus Lloydbacteria bacterium RIFCSPHIGHO2_01_FULL_41_20]
MKWNLNKKEEKIFKCLSTPVKIQDFLNGIPNNFEKNGETCMSPRRVLREKKAHCIEGAMFSASALLYNGKSPLLVHFATNKDEDHVIAVFKKNGLWGAISKSNHSLMRYRDPVYKTIRELCMSYFNEYFMYENGRKTLVGYTKPINLKKFGTNWITREEELWKINDALFDAPHLPIAPKKILKTLRPVDPIEIKITKITDWKKK